MEHLSQGFFFCCFLCFISRTEEACFRGQTEERARELEGSEEAMERGFPSIRKEVRQTVVERADGKGSSTSPVGDWWKGREKRCKERLLEAEWRGDEASIRCFQDR